jgi:hypothetical protein
MAKGTRYDVLRRFWRHELRTGGRLRLIAERPKSGNQGGLSSNPFSQIADFKRKGSRNGARDTSIVSPSQCLSSLRWISSENSAAPL